MRRLAIVTGASRGIGRATAILLAESMCDLLLVARNKGALEETAADCRQLGCEATVFAADLSDLSCGAAIIRKAREVAANHYPVIVNNAGVAEFGSFDQQAIELFERHVQLNFMAGVALCHAAVPWMLELGGGQVINVLSIAATNPFSGAAAYCASKAAFRMFSKVLAQEYRARGIRVSALVPGSTDTNLWDANAWKPESSDMLPPGAVAEAIRDIVLSPKDRNFDEVVLMPPNGIL